MKVNIALFESIHLFTHRSQLRPHRRSNPTYHRKLCFQGYTLDLLDTRDHDQVECNDLIHETRKAFVHMYHKICLFYSRYLLNLTTIFITAIQTISCVIAHQFRMSIQESSKAVASLFITSICTIKDSIALFLLIYTPRPSE